MNKQAIRHMLNRDFNYCISDRTFVIRLITAKGDISSVNYVYKDKYMKRDNPLVKLPMIKVASDSLHDYYEVCFDNWHLSVRYFFELTDENETCYYSNYHFYKETPVDDDAFFTMPKRMHEVDALHDIPWMNSGVVYQIFPDRFNRGSSQTKKGLTKWDKKMPHYKDLFGGTINGITEKLDYIHELGADILYLTPIFKSPSSHKYDTTDYMEIDPDFGTLEDLKELSNECHKRDMHIILDCVFDHSGWTFEPFQDLTKKGGDSEYLDWFYINHLPIRKQFLGVTDYDTFSYFGGMPKLNVSSPKVRSYVADFIKHWMRECNIDGWRLDVADEVAHSFWTYFRGLVKAEKPDAPIIGEVWYDPSDWLHGDEFDSSMNYPFSNAVNKWIASSSITPSEFMDDLGFIRGNTNRNAFNMLWNLIDSHDSARFLHCAGEDKRKLKLAILLQMTLSGTPMIYYGDEVGMTGGNDPECRRGMIWDEDKQDHELFDYYKLLINIRKNHPCLYQGELKTEYVDDKSNVVVYSKEYNNDKLYILVNNSDKDYKYEFSKDTTYLYKCCQSPDIVSAYSGIIYMK